MTERVKIESITAKNIKAISEFTAVFAGKSAHISGRNGVGKSTFIRVLWDRLVGLEPSIIVKIGEEEGMYAMALTDGAKLVWEFNKFGGEKITYTTSEGLLVKKDILKAIISRYFKNQFDIHKFLTATEPRKRLDMISKLINIDLSKVQGRYAVSFKNRAELKRDLKVLESQIMPKPVFESKIDPDTYTEPEKKKLSEFSGKLKTEKTNESSERKRLNDLYKKNVTENKKTQKDAEVKYQTKLDKWQALENQIKAGFEAFNAIQESNFEKKHELISLKDEIHGKIAISEFKALFDYTEADKIIKNMPKSHQLLVFEDSKRPDRAELNLSDPMPGQIQLKEITDKIQVIESDITIAEFDLQYKESEISEIKAKKSAHKILLENYSNFQKQIDSKIVIVNDAENRVQSILNEIKKIISGAKLPSEFSIDLTNKNDILFNGFSITNETLASSAIYIAAFKLAIYNLDLFRVVHFDISNLDYENRLEVAKVAKEMDIQLLSESPATEKHQTTELNYVITDESE